MEIASWIVLVAGLMPYVIVGIAKAGPGYDNANPRALENLKDRKRMLAYNAHQNALEAFPFFAAGVLLALVLNADAKLINLLAVVWLVARIGYAWAYITDRPSVRSSFWFVAKLAAIGIYLVALLQMGS